MQSRQTDLASPTRERYPAADMTRSVTVALAISFPLLAGCLGSATVGVRPDGSPGPEPCSDKALHDMRLMSLHPAESAWIDVDLKQKGQDRITVNDGPIVSVLQERLGPSLDEGTLLYGRVWTGGPDVVIRYYRAELPDGGPAIEFCGVARLSNGKMRKHPGPTPSSAVLEFGRAGVDVVHSFR